jgi:hypothetical protein
MRSDPQLLDPATHRLTVLATSRAAPPCRELLASAIDRGDLYALARWRFQIAAHLAGDEPIVVEVERSQVRSIVSRR